MQYFQPSPLLLLTTVFSFLRPSLPYIIPHSLSDYQTSYIVILHRFSLPLQITPSAIILCWYTLIYISISLFIISNTPITKLMLFSYSVSLPVTSASLPINLSFTSAHPTTFSHCFSHQTYTFFHLHGLNKDGKRRVFGLQ